MKIIEYEESFGESVFSTLGIYETEEQKQAILDRAMSLWLLEPNLKHIRTRDITLGVYLD